MSYSPLQLVPPRDDDDRDDVPSLPSPDLLPPYRSDAVECSHRRPPLVAAAAAGMFSERRPGPWGIRNGPPGASASADWNAVDGGSAGAKRHGPLPPVAVVPVRRALASESASRETTIGARMPPSKLPWRFVVVVVVP